MSANSNRIGGFELIRKLPDQGWQGIVFEARCVEAVMRDVAVGSRVALKYMSVPDPDGDFARRLKKRTDTLAAMRHPNMVRYYGSFSYKGGPLDDQEFPVIVMEYLEGSTLKKRLEKEHYGLDVDLGLAIFRDCLSVLIYAAGHNIIHRDLKPSNIFLCADDAVKLIDFEIARQEGGTVTGSSQGNLRGTFDYMAPDFLEPSFHGDERSDVFSLAVCLHEALVGRTPYVKRRDEANQGDFVFHNRWFGRTDASDGGVIKVSSRIQTLVPRLKPVLEQGLSPDREQRLASFKAFEAALRTVQPHELANEGKRYALLQLIGQGGFGKVYKGRRVSDGRQVAVKCLLRSEYADRFKREAELIRRLSGSSLVRFVDFFAVAHVGGEQYFLVMDYLPGMPGYSLRDRLKAGEALPFEEVITAFARYAEGLASMHQEKVYHRDIKPSNLYLPAGHPETACIMDLGVARDAKGTVTHGHVPGSLDYMPPEVVFGSSRGDEGMDLFALGLCLFEALTGSHAYPRLPAGDQALIGLSKRARDKEKPKLDHPLVTCHPALCALLRKMTDPELERRLCSAVEVATALRRILSDGDEPEHPVAEDGPHTSATAITPVLPQPVQPAASGGGQDGSANALPTIDGGTTLPRKIPVSDGGDGKTHIAPPPSPKEKPSPHEEEPTGATVFPEKGLRDKLDKEIMRLAQRKAPHPPRVRWQVPSGFWRWAGRAAAGAATLAVLVASGTGVYRYRAAVKHAIIPPCNRAVARVRGWWADVSTREAFERTVQAARTEIAKIQPPSAPERVPASAYQLEAVQARYAAELAGLTNRVLPSVAKKRADDFNTEIGEGILEKSRAVSEHAKRQALQAVKEALLKYGQNDITNGVAEHNLYDTWCKNAGMEKERSDELWQAYAACTNRIATLNLNDGKRKAEELERSRWQELLNRSVAAAQAYANAGIDDRAELSKQCGALSGQINEARSFKGGKVRTDEAERVLVLLRERLTALTNPVIVRVAGQEPELKPSVTVKVSLDGQKTWGVLNASAVTNALPGSKVWARFERPDHAQKDPVPFDVLPGEACVISLPAQEAWRRSVALERLDILRGQVQKGQWQAASAHTNRADTIRFDHLGHETEWKNLIAQVCDYWKKVEGDRRDEEERRTRARLAETARQQEVTVLKGRLQSYRDEIGRGAVTLPADWAWPHPAKGVAEDPAVVGAGQELAAAVSNWVAAVACADEPLTNRAERLSNAVGLLARPGVGNLLVPSCSAALRERVVTARKVFVLRVENRSGLAVTMRVGRSEESLEAAGRREFRLSTKVEAALALVPGYEEQSLPFRWAEGGGQQVVIGRFTPRPVEVVISGDESGLRPPVRLVLADAAGSAVTDKPGAVALRPGSYALTWSRTDYLPQEMKLVLQPGDGPQRIGVPGRWEQTDALKMLLEAGAACVAKRYEQAAALLPKSAPLADAGYQNTKLKIEEEVIGHYAALAEKELAAERAWQKEARLREFQVADPETGALRKERGEPVPPKPVKTLIDAWVVGRFPDGLKERWQGTGRDVELENVLAICRDAHGPYFLDNHGQKNDYFPWEVSVKLSEAVSLGYVPNEYDLTLAGYTLKKCEEEYKRKVDFGIKMDAYKLEQARAATRKIREAKKRTPSRF